MAIEKAPSKIQWMIMVNEGISSYSDEERWAEAERRSSRGVATEVLDRERREMESEGGQRAIYT